MAGKEYRESEWYKTGDREDLEELIGQVGQRCPAWKVEGLQNKLNKIAEWVKSGTVLEAAGKYRRLLEHIEEDLAQHADVKGKDLAGHVKRANVKLHHLDEIEGEDAMDKIEELG